MEIIKSAFKIIGLIIVFVFLSWLFREIIGYLTVLVLMIFTVFTFILDTFLLFTGMDDSFGISKSYVEMCIGSHLIYAWIFWDVLILGFFVVWFLKDYEANTSSKDTSNGNKQSTKSRKLTDMQELEFEVSKIKAKYRNSLHFSKTDANKQIRKTIQKWCNKNGSFMRVQELYDKMKLSEESLTSIKDKYKRHYATEKNEWLANTSTRSYPGRKW